LQPVFQFAIIAVLNGLGTQLNSTFTSVKNSSPGSSLRPRLELIGRPPQLAASFFTTKRAMSLIGNYHAIAATRHFARYWGNSGQKSILTRDGLSANDPKDIVLIQESALHDAHYHNAKKRGLFREIAAFRTNRQKSPRRPIGD